MPDVAFYKDLLNSLADAPDEYHEIVIDPRTGLPRQAGATLPEGEFVQNFKHTAERSLYVFSKGVMQRGYLTPSLHWPVCDFIQKIPPFRKLLLLPREHAKTSVVSHCLPIHRIIQSVANNIYLPNHEGSESRILLCGETSARAESNLRVIRTAFEANAVLRAFWPHRTWTDPRRQTRKWNDQELILPREIEWPDPTIRAIGVGGAITGARPTDLIKDDLISLEAANSEAVMETAIEWHRASRALMEEYEKNTGWESLEFILGTRWAVYDLYEYITQTDPTVEILVRAIIEDDQPIWPERFDHERIEQLKREFGSMFWLLYMNSAADPELTDFDVSQIRSFEIHGDQFVFDEDGRDIALAEHLQKIVEAPHAPRGAKLESKTWEMLLGRGRGEYLRLKYG